MIEIGVGIGGVISYILQGFGNSKEGIGFNVGLYDFMDVFFGFFEVVKEKFQDWNNVVKYKKFDIEQDLMK